jgi:glycosyltransferase involved in cell wall biosynthesis
VDVTIEVWRNAKPSNARLVLYGADIRPPDSLGKPSRSLRYGKIHSDFYDRERVTILKPIEPLTHWEMSSLYRGADVLVLNSRSEGFGFSVVEAMACGTLSIVTNNGGTRDFVNGSNCLTISGSPVPADYRDKGFGVVGNWWEPSKAELASAIIRSYEMDSREKKEMEHKARQFVLNNFTWRHVAFELWENLRIMNEERKTSSFPASIRRHAQDRSTEMSLTASNSGMASEGNPPDTSLERLLKSFHCHVREGNTSVQLICQKE